MCLMMPGRVVAVDGEICQVETAGQVDRASMTARGGGSKGVPIEQSIAPPSKAEANTRYCSRRS